MDVSEHELQGLYTWVDEIPLSRPKRNIARDFSDGVLMAEIVGHYFPKLVELHNYSSANGLQQKLYNWNTLNGKVFRKLGFIVCKQDCEAVSNCVPGSVERVLKLIKNKLSVYKDDSGSAPIIGPALKGPGGVFENAMAMPRHVSAGSAAGGFMTPAMDTRATAPMVTAKMTAALAPELIAERDQVINELKETNQILETKVRKLEQLVRLKDAKIQTLMAKLTSAGLS